MAVGQQIGLVEEKRENEEEMLSESEERKRQGNGKKKKKLKYYHKCEHTNIIIYILHLNYSAQSKVAIYYS